MAKNDKEETTEAEIEKAKADAEAFAQLEAEEAAKAKTDADALAQLEAEEAAMAKAAENASSVEGLVEMSKGGETIHVHPTAVKDHETVGWTHA